MSSRLSVYAALAAIVAGAKNARVEFVKRSDPGVNCAAYAHAHVTDGRSTLRLTLSLLHSPTGPYLAGIVDDGLWETSASPYSPSNADARLTPEELASAMNLVLAARGEYPDVLGRLGVLLREATAERKLAEVA